MVNSWREPRRVRVIGEMLKAGFCTGVILTEEVRFRKPVFLCWSCLRRFLVLCLNAAVFDDLPGARG